MDKNGDEHKDFKQKYEEEQKYRRDHPKEYPWFVYHQYGFHRQQYLSEEEAQEEIAFYKLKPYTQEKGDTAYERFGRQPITLMRRD